MTDPWWLRGACFGQNPADWLAPTRTSPGADGRVRVAALKRICASCPVTAQCLDAALDEHDEHAVRGGLTPWERASMRRPVVKPHGTRRRYMAGCRCDPCSVANSIYHREQRIRRGEAS